MDKIGVLLMNLGTPSSLQTGDIKDFLAEFLSDKRIVNLPAWRWKPILHGIILQTRPRVTAQKYKSIWMTEGSPLLKHTQNLAELLQNKMQPEGGFLVDYAMRYGQPDVAQTLGDFLAQGVKKVLIFPLYPQYSSTTTASAYDAIYTWGSQQIFVPEFRFINDYHEHTGYIDALCESVRKSWQENGRSEKLIISFHSVPEQLIIDGDPYQQQCIQTAKRLTDRLRLSQDEYVVTYQSRFGKDKWLEPTTLSTIESLAQLGTKSLDVICPGFSADCLETLEEINIECREAFAEQGGEQFHYIPCLNDDEKWAESAIQIIKQHTKGWKDASV